MLSPGDRFEGYVVDAIVGHGGFATVYQAHQGTAPGRTVALKVLADRRRGPADRTRLRREFDVARQLQHPHIIPVFEIGPDWLSMEYVSGGQISDLPTVPNRLAALGQIADALDYAHERGIAHCDVQPSNILVSQSFYEYGAMLVDFGSALSIGGESGPSAPHVAASLPYCPPELLTGKAPAGATDEYSLALHRGRIDHRKTTIHSQHPGWPDGRAAAQSASPAIAPNRLATKSIRFNLGEGHGEASAGSIPVLPRADSANYPRCRRLKRQFRS